MSLNLEVILRYGLYIGFGLVSIALLYFVTWGVEHMFSYTLVSKIVLQLPFFLLVKGGIRRARKEADQWSWLDGFVHGLGMFAVAGLMCGLTSFLWFVLPEHREDYYTYQYHELISENQTVEALIAQKDFILSFATPLLRFGFSWIAVLLPGAAFALLYAFTYREKPTESPSHTHLGLQS
ncbi:DUF4199 domain-containing protein [Pontibacter sp. G13]|uniref:DUF4199 domain-containing protein n=1 Tax=Pontibacter sp. G13 TaxID=3074898 RepID=UPI00288A0865|nr:DUF4199 domain-containing protein [Pontibacter sp. G13]WNJ19307.1 DUF4199 domain-containing protein [Pontibacter sp. G13]